MTTSGIIERILENRNKFSARNKKKESSERALIEKQQVEHEQRLKTLAASSQ